MHRAYGDLSISCHKSGVPIANATATSSARGWLFGNLLFGGPIGLGVDIGTGAGYDYPQQITVMAGNGTPSRARPTFTDATSSEVTSLSVALPSSTTTTLAAAPPSFGTTRFVRPASAPTPAIEQDVPGGDVGGSMVKASARTLCPYASNRVSRSVRVFDAEALDTNIFIFTIKNEPKYVRDRFNRCRGQLCIGAVTLMELFYGAEKSAMPERNLAVVDGFATRLDVLNYDHDAAAHCGQLRAALAKAGKPISPYDQMIAGHARAEGFILVTNNLHEFERAPGLRVEDWTEAGV